MEFRSTHGGEPRFKGRMQTISLVVRFQFAHFFFDASSHATRRVKGKRLKKLDIAATLLYDLFQIAPEDGGTALARNPEGMLIWHNVYMRNGHGHAFYSLVLLRKGVRTVAQLREEGSGDDVNLPPNWQPIYLQALNMLSALPR